MYSIKILGQGILMLMVATLAALNLIASEQNSERQPLKIKQKENIRVVYQIKTDDWKNGVGAGLHYVEKLAKAYEKMGIEDNAFQVSAVLHGDAGYWLLKDDIYKQKIDKAETNPNKNIVRRLLKRGVSIELCAQTMKSHGWKAADILPGVTIVIGAYPRIIDLQHRGYAYIRF